MEKMLVAQALDERDFLRKKILEKITKLDVATVVKISDTATDNGIELEKYKSDAISAVQSIRDQIKRYKAINLAINNSNAKETVVVCGTTMTRAEAITMRKYHSSIVDLDYKLNEVLYTQISKAKVSYSNLKSLYERTKDKHISTLLQSDKAAELDKDQIDAIDTITKRDIPVIIDPLNLIDKVDTFIDDQERFYKELETAIKVSNASTFIEIE